MFVAIAVGHVFAGAPPAPDAGGGEILGFLSSDAGLHKTQAVVSILGLPPLALFVAGLLVPFAASDREHHEGWANVILIGAVALASGVAAGDGVLYGLFLRGGEGLDPAMVRGLWDIQYVSYAGAGVAVAVIAGGAAVPVLRHGVFPRWHGWMSLLFGLLGLLAVIDTVTTAAAGAFHASAIVGFSIIWVTATSIVLFRNTEMSRIRDEQPVSG